MITDANSTDYREAAIRAYARAGVVALAYTFTVDKTEENEPVTYYNYIATCAIPSHPPSWMCYWDIEDRTPDELEAHIYNQITTPPVLNEFTILDVYKTKLDE